MRNDHMRERYLEVGKGEGFAKAVLSEIRLTDARLATFEGATAFTGTLSLHGTGRPVPGRAQVRRMAPPCASRRASPCASWSTGSRARSTSGWA